MKYQSKTSVCAAWAFVEEDVFFLFCNHLDPRLDHCFTINQYMLLGKYRKSVGDSVNGGLRTGHGIGADCRNVEDADPLPFVPRTSTVRRASTAAARHKREDVDTRPPANAGEQLIGAEGLPTGSA
jgi:hypothetical protein